MYIWMGCRLPEEFEDKIREKCVPVAQELGLDISGFTLPQHISLKISFDAGERYPEILDAIEVLLRREGPFSVVPTGIEQHGNILWVAFRENGVLRRLHNLLDRDLKRDHGIPQHMFDKAFFFHSTLLLGSEEGVRRMRERLADYLLPEEMEIDTFLLGVSESGKSGTYRVVREIKV